MIFSSWGCLPPAYIWDLNRWLFFYTILTNNHYCLFNNISSKILFSLFYWAITLPEKTAYKLYLSLDQIFIHCLCVNYCLIGLEGERETEKERGRKSMYPDSKWIHLMLWLEPRLWVYCVAFWPVVYHQEAFEVPVIWSA